MAGVELDLAPADSFISVISAHLRRRKLQAVHVELARNNLAALSSPTSITMLALAALSALSFTPPPTNVGTRRDLLASAFSAAAFAPVAAAVFANSAPAPAFAQRSKLVPKSSKEATESYKQFQLSQPKAESEAFKEAEKRRKAFESGGSKGPESAADEMALFRSESASRCTDGEAPGAS